MKHLLLFFLRVYRYFLSPLVGNQCRFYPTCSCYGYEAINMHGCFLGGLILLWRLLRCHRWAAGGVDLVPKTLTIRYFYE